jgi:membrane protein implicated in regulation of membrane protease activity
MRIAESCERYWIETKIPRRVAREMRLELETHLTEAVDEGRSPHDVVGPDLAGFAEAWAREQRPGMTRALPSWDEVASGQTAAMRSWWFAGIGYASLVAATVLVGYLTGGRGSMENNEIWRWVWTGLAVTLSIAEIFTFGFFLLPFGIGAAAAAVLAWLNVGLLAQWIVFFVVSGASLWYTQRFIRHQDTLENIGFGANRYIGEPAVVLERIDPAAGTGMVRVESEAWRATTDGEVIEQGERVTVTAVRGTKLVVAKNE